MNIALKNGKHVRVYTKYEYINKVGHIDDVVRFYNEYLPLSKHSSDYKARRYETSRTIILIVMDEDEIIGLMESWIATNKRHLVTAITHKKYTKLGMFSKLFEIMKKELKKINCGKIYIHFRNSNYDSHSKIYSKVGFKPVVHNDKYTNDEHMWEMVYDFNNNNISGEPFEKTNRKNGLLRQINFFKRKIKGLSIC